MINYTTGDLLSSSAHALVNTVNTVGIMGKGIALQFKTYFPENFRIYQRACKDGTLKIGKLLVVHDANITMGERTIINFPTKQHWRNPSQYYYIEEGLKALRETIINEKIHDIAIPPLGCGNGGLDWTTVREMIETHLSDLANVNIMVFEPNRDYTNTLRHKKSEAKLTDARAMLLYSLFYYEMFDERTNLVVANKLSYFYQLCGEPAFAKLRFTPSHYGPYTPAVAHMLHAVNGKYLHGLEQMDTKPFDLLDLDYAYRQEISNYIHNLSHQSINNIKKVIKLTEGFESTLALEILATVAYIIHENPAITLSDTIEAVRKWSPRKARLFSEQYIEIAYSQIQTHLYA